MLKDSWKKEHYENKRTGVKYSKSLNNIDVAEIIDFNSCIDFISKYNIKNTINNSKLDIGITVPENIIFLIDRNDEEFFKDEFGIEKDSENIISKIYKFLFSVNEAKAYTKGRSIKQNFLDKLGISIFCNYSRTYLKESNRYNNDEIYDIDKCLYDDKIKKLETFYKNTDCKTISEYLLKLFNCLGCENDEKKIIEFINFCISIDDKYFRCLYLEFYIDFNTTKDKEDIKKFFELYKNITKTSEFIRQRFIPNPSDGEYSTMIFYSRLYNEFNDNDSNKLLETKNLLLLIDEAEITMHPSLQQKFVKNLIDFFNIFLPKFKVQVIIATHSPVILSDIPKTNVVFLKKGPGSKSTSIVKFDSDSNTFLANYLELYKNSFFLDEGFIGHFARQKIKGLLSNIENGKFDNYDEYILSIIGEPILKKTLKDYCIIKKSKK